MCVIGCQRSATEDCPTARLASGTWKSQCRGDSWGKAGCLCDLRCLCSARPRHVSSARLENAPSRGSQAPPCARWLIQSQQAGSHIRGTFVPSLGRKGSMDSQVRSVQAVLCTCTTSPLASLEGSMPAHGSFRWTTLTKPLFHAAFPSCVVPVAPRSARGNARITQGVMVLGVPIPSVFQGAYQQRDRRSFNVGCVVVARHTASGRHGLVRAGCDARGRQTLVQSGDMMCRGGQCHCLSVAVRARREAGSPYCIIVAFPRLSGG